MRNPAQLLRTAVAALLFSVVVASAAAPPVQWEKTFGGASTEGADGDRAVQQTSDGGYIFVGGTWSFGAGGCDVYVLKVDSAGIMEWQKTFGGVRDDGGASVQQTTDGAYIIAGTTFSFGHGLSDVYLLKIDAAGDVLWTNTLGGWNDECSTSVRQTSDGGYIIGGATLTFGPFGPGVEAYYLVKTDSGGNQVWQKAFGGYDARGWSVVQTTDGGYMFAGVTRSSGGGDNDVCLIKTDENGGLQWQKTFSGGHADHNRAWSVQQTADAGYIVAGTSAAGVTGSDVLLMKTDTNGSLTWCKTFGGSDEDWGASVWQTTDGGFVVAGRTRSSGAGGYDVYVIKTDADGNEDWSKTLGGSGEDAGASVQQTSDGGYIIAGWTSSFGAGAADAYLIKLEPSETPPPNLPPVAQCQNVQKSADENCQAVVLPQEVDGGSYDPDGDVITLSLDPAGPYLMGETIVTLTAIDPSGASSQCTATITVVDQTPPNITCPTSIVLEAPSAAGVPASDPAIVAFLDEASAVDNCDSSPTISHTEIPQSFPLGTTSVTFTATDASSNASNCVATVTVQDTTPPAIAVAAPEPYGLYAAGSLTLGFSAVDAVGVTELSGRLEDPAGYSQSVTSGFQPGAGVYTLIVSAADAAGNQAEIEVFFVVYDPAAGFVTGGGWIQSPTGAYKPDPSLAGAANFGFVSRYKKGATVPEGQTQFVFQTGNLNFHSSSYEWLVVTGSEYARFKGTGAINGSGPYNFMLWAGDGPDTFRIRIWAEDDDGTETDVYDNGFDQGIAGGSIVIHAN